MFSLALALYFRLVSTTLIEPEVPEDGVIFLPAMDNQREVLLVDPTMLFGTNEQSRNGPPSDNTGPSDISTEKVRQIIGNQTGPADIKYRVNDNLGSDLLNYLKKARVHSENETLHSSGPQSTRLLERILGKGFNNKPSPSLLAFLRELTTQPSDNDIGKLPHSKLPETLSRQGVENERSERWTHSNFDLLDPLFLKSFKKPASGDAKTHLMSRSTTPRRVDRKEKALDPLRWLSNDSGSSNLLSSFKRSRRQAENETEKLAELPLWAGMPQAALRVSHMKTEEVKKKLLSMMLQSLYSAQERLWPLGPIVRKYDRLAPYRMAFIFLKLDQLVNEGHQIFMYLKRQALNKAMDITRRLQLYSQIMRRNIDVTYLVDYIMQRVPQDQVVRIRQWVIRTEQEAIMQKKEIIWKLEPYMQQYENDTDYRMAFIFLKLEQLMKDSRSILAFISMERNRHQKNVVYKFQDTQRLQVYWQLVRKNVDVTALVDYIIQRVPLGTEGNDSRRYLDMP